MPETRARGPGSNGRGPLDAYRSEVGAEGIQGYSEMIKLEKPFGFSEFGLDNAKNPSGNFDYRIFVRGMQS